MYYHFISAIKMSSAIKMNPTTTFVVFLQVTCLYCAPMNLLPQIQQAIQWPQLQQPMVQMPQLPGQQEIQQSIHWSHLQQPSVHLGQMPQVPQISLTVPGQMEAEQVALEKQMMALQQWQVLQKLNMIHAPVPMAMTPPLLIIIPNSQDLINGNELTKTTKQNDNELKHDTGHTNEELDSVIIENIDTEKNEIEESIPKAILLLPNSRFSIGGVISTIPWLPIEVNVPDTIAWGYNGISNWISGIISIIGQRFPFRRPQATTDAVVKPTDAMASQNANVKMFLKKLQKKEEPVMPILVVPLGGTLSPFQIID